MAVEENNLLTDDIIIKEALRLLKNNLVFAALVFRDFEKQFIKKVGATIRVELPTRIKSASGALLVKQPLVDLSTDLTIANQEHVGLEYGMVDLTLSITRFSEKYLKSGMESLANKIDRSIAETLAQTFHTSGTPGTRPTEFIDYANAGAKQTTYGIPLEDRKAIITPFTEANLSDSVTKLFNTSKTDSAFTKGYSGECSKYMTYCDQNLPTHTVGQQGGTPLTAEVGTNTSTIATDGWTASKFGVLLKGDIITFADVFGVNPQSYESTGLLQEFVVTDVQVDSDAGGLASINFSPEMNDGNATVTNPGGASVSTAAYQNVSNLPADGAAITVSGDANGIYEVNYLFHREAIALAMVDIELPRTAVVKSRASDPSTGLSLTITGAFDVSGYAETTRVDALWGTKLIYPEMALRLWGAKNGTAIALTS